MSKATITHTDEELDRAERRRTKRILDFRHIGVFIEEDTPLDEMPEIDQITRLRMLATKHRRPIGNLDLTDRAAVNRELDRLQMLEGGTRRRGSYRTIRVAPTPSNLSTAEMRQRAAQSRRTRDARYAGGRFVETSGYGSHASYSVQTAEARSMGAENLVREATEGQIGYIRSLSQQKRIQSCARLSPQKMRLLPTRVRRRPKLLLTAPAELCGHLTRRFPTCKVSGDPSYRWRLPGGPQRCHYFPRWLRPTASS